eukprot:3858431-Pyramimonas_sp.AAC.1
MLAPEGASTARPRRMPAMTIRGLWAPTRAPSDWQRETGETDVRLLVGHLRLASSAAPLGLELRRAGRAD